MNTSDQFHPLILKWFTEQIGQPTDVQAEAWPRIANGEHVLITAPTGSGKTLTAFLWALNQLITNLWSNGHTSVLYISPLKALNNDIQRNLITPLVELKEVFENAGVSFPDIRVQTRSGDTPQSDRMRMQRHPPEILITTPESLNLILSSPNARSMLRDLSTVILDEIHGVINTKRGTHLITAVDRLIPLCGEFQRISLSATIKPLETVARFVAGSTIEGIAHNPTYVERPISIVQSEAAKEYDVHVRFPEDALDWQTHESLWDPLVDDFKRIIGKNRSTLLFTNGRRLTEKVTHMINDGEDRVIAYSHHGSLSREIRTEVEHKLKAGDLKAIVATNSLEMGIDIGALDEVVLIQSPPSISSTIQRVGRAGHRVGEISRGTIFPTHSQDFLQAAVLAAGILDRDIEDIHPIDCPLDVLAQVIVSMVGVETWDIDILHAHLLSSYPYRNLSREQFDLVLNMLGGRYADSRIRELKPRVSIDRLDNTVTARKGALLAVYMSGGMIPDRGYFHLRHNETNAFIGELDEEFVWEASVGQLFTLGAQNWKIERITHNDVFVSPGNPKALAPPFWIGEEQNRDFYFSERIAEFLAKANESLDAPEYTGILKHKHCMDDPAAKQLIDFLKRQKEETECDLPHRHHLLLEYVSSGPGGFPGNQLVIHTLWGGQVNRPLAMALDAAWEERYEQKLELYTGDDCIVLQLPHDIRGEEVLSLVTSTNVDKYIRKRLESSGYFGARFRECAGRALLFSRNKLTERMPLWMSRLRSQKLMDTVMKYEDFPILLEAWRTCLQDEFDIDSLRLILTELESGTIGWSETHTSHPSPMAQGTTWRQITEYMYMTDEPTGGKTSQLRGDLFCDVVFTPTIRPTIPPEIVEQFELKRQRLALGYAPETSRELLDWVKERLIIPLREWDRLLQAVQHDHNIKPDEILHPIESKIVRIESSLTSEVLITSLETLPRLSFGLWPEFATQQSITCLDTTIPDVTQYKTEEDRDEVLTSILGEWLQFYGPTTPEFLRTTLGIEPGLLQLSLEDLIDSEAIISGSLVSEGTDNEICDSENFEILLRLTRRDAIPAFEPVEIDWLPLFLAHYQNLTNPSDDADGLFQSIEQLICYPADASRWESEILPARLQPYSTSLLDSIMQEGDLRWVGSENHRVSFCFESDLDLLHDDQAESMEILRNIDSLFPDPAGRYDFSTLLRTSNQSPSELSDRLWDGVWHGQITNDSFASLRKGIENRFKVPNTIAQTRQHAKGRRSGGRASFARWKGSIPFSGNWFVLPEPDTVDDLIEIEENNKERVRILLDRYGILFRELLAYESTVFQWRNLFRSLRLMELSGEILAGYFFEGISGPQFISHQAFRMLQRKLPEDTIFWINATDPASLCGIQIETIKGSLPKRVPSTHIVYKGRDIVVVSQRNGKSLTFNTSPDDPDLPECLGFLRHLLTRQFQPLRRINIETINGEDAARSPYLNTLRTSFELMIEHKSVILYNNAFGK